MNWTGKLFWGAVAASAATAAGCVAVFTCSQSVGSVPVLDPEGMAFKIMPFLESFVFVENVVALSLLVRKKSYASTVGWVLAFAAVATGGAFVVASTDSGPTEMVRWSLYLMLDVGAALLFAFAIGWALPKWRGIRHNSAVAPDV